MSLPSITLTGHISTRTIIGQLENVWRMAYVRGPEGILAALAERIS